MKKILLIALLFAGCTRSVDSPNTVSNGDTYLKYHIGTSTTEMVFTGSQISINKRAYGGGPLVPSPGDPRYEYQITARDKNIEVNSVELFIFGDPIGTVYPFSNTQSVFSIDGKSYLGATRLRNSTINTTLTRTTKTTITRYSNGTIDGTFAGTIYPLQSSVNGVIGSPLQIEGEFKNVKSQ